MIPTRRPTLTGLPRLYAEPFPLVRRRGHDRPTLISRQTPTEIPRACRLEVTTQIVRKRDGALVFQDVVPGRRETMLPPPPEPRFGAHHLVSVVWALAVALWIVQVMR